MRGLDGLPPPSEHALALAGWPLVEAQPPRVESLEANEVVVVVSRSRDPLAEVLVEHCRTDSVPVLQRPSGGGAVVLAPGVVAASALHRAAPPALFPDRFFAHYCGVVARALEECGVHGVTRRGTSDLCLGDRKLAGTSLRLFRGCVLFQVSVLVDVEVTLLERYLREPARAPEYRDGRRHRDFVTTLRAAASAATTTEVAAALHRVLSQTPP